MEDLSNKKGSVPYRFGALQYIYHRAYRDQTLDKRHFMYDRIHRAKTLYRKDLKGHYGCVNAIEFSNNGGELIASGGDDRRVLVWKTENALNEVGSPLSMKGQHHSNIFCLAFDNENTKILSGGNDEQVVLHDIESGATADVYTHEDAVYGLAVDPLNSSVFASACDDGRILIYDIRAPPSEDPFCLANYMSPMHAVVYNPMEPRLLATANSKEGIGLWDVRKPKSCLMRYGGSLSQQSCMSVRVNRLGNRIIALRRRLPPVMYDIHSAAPVFQFDHSGYYNSCTMKSCCFAGEKDEFLLSGSDDFNLYMWKIPDIPGEVPWVGEAHMVLKGHRSIVNQVRFNPANQLILSSGVEKVIKMWSPYKIPQGMGCSSPHSRSESPQRTVYSHEQYINLVLGSGEVMTHDYSQQSTEEDPRMMAFFDSLVQRELEGWSTDEMPDSDAGLYEGFAHTVQSSTPASAGSESCSEEEGGFSPFTIAFASVMARQELQESQDDSNPPRRLLDLDGAEAVTGSPTRTGSNSSGEESRESTARRRAGDETHNAPTEPDANSDNNADTAHQVASDMPSSSTHQEDDQSSRRSISDLIAQKRKEYLASVKRAQKRASAKRRPKQSWNSTKHRKRLKLVCSRVKEEESSSSDSDFVNARFSSDCSSSGSSWDGTEVNGNLGLFEQHRKKMLDLKRLKNLRSRVMNSDSDSDREGVSNMNKVPSTVTSGVSTHNVNGVSSNCKDGSDTSEVGPHLTEGFFDNRQFGTSSSTTDGKSRADFDNNHAIPSTSQVLEGATTLTNNGVQGKLGAKRNGDDNLENINNSSKVNSGSKEFTKLKNCSDKKKRNYRGQRRKISSDDD